MTAIYHVKTPSGDRLIEANTQAQAINFAVKSTVTASPISAVALSGFLKQGLEIEKAIAQTEAPAAAPHPTNTEEPKNVAAR